MMLIRLLFDFIFPPHQDELRMRTLTEGEVRSLMRATCHGDTTVLFPYHHPLVKTLIWQLKYRDDMRAVALLGGALASYLKAELDGSFVVIPIPLSATRKRERGYNQVARFASHALKDLPRFTLREDILRRVRHAERQTTLTRLDRIRNMRDMFEVATPAVLTGMDVILLDDVITTGATMREAEKALIGAGARKVIKIALAH